MSADQHLNVYEITLQVKTNVALMTDDINLIAGLIESNANLGPKGVFNILDVSIALKHSWIEE